MIYKYATDILAWLSSWLWTYDNPDSRYYVDHNISEMDVLTENFLKKDHVLIGTRASEICIKSRELHENILNHLIKCDSLLYRGSYSPERYRAIIAAVARDFKPDDCMARFLLRIKDVETLPVLDQKYLVMYQVNDDNTMNFLHIFVEKINDKEVCLEYYCCHVTI